MDILTEAEIKRLTPKMSAADFNRVLHTLEWQRRTLERVARNPLIDFAGNAHAIETLLDDPEQRASLFRRAMSDLEVRALLEGLFRALALFEASLRYAEWRDPATDPR